MELLVLNTSFESVAVVDVFESCIWTDRYRQCGDFEIYTPMDVSLLAFLKPDYYLWSQDSEHTMIIETLNIETDTENGAHLKVEGRSLESILDRRIIWGQKVLKGNLQDEIEKLLNETIISPSIAERKISNFVFQKTDDPTITALTIDAQYTGDILYDVIKNLCEDNKIGFKIVLNDQNEFVFSLYTGKNRSYDQIENPYVIFSPSYENIINSNYLESKKSLKNVTLVAGEGEGASRRTTIVGSGKGLERRELFTDARDISSDTGDNHLSDSEYMNQLVQRGKENLSENIATKTFEGEVEATQMFKYNSDFFIGDIVQIENEYGHTGKAYISEFIMSQDKNEISNYPTFETIQEEGESEQ
ncbi:MAG: siphovirus ReqiPepy6 Gp37-like family protein [Eubacteriales bacterium]|nr:siphovirus ReqiPepy6 Gp37-like family protein [Eubacteriales bacterium]